MIIDVLLSGGKPGVYTNIGEAGNLIMIRDIINNDLDKTHQVR